MSPHETIAHYRITGKLGEGGMGAVYRATDTKLHRDVAIKVIPDSFARDPDRMARFAREAQVLAALNHPNIAAIYGVEERALVMELVPGEALAGPLPMEEALPIIHQIIDALEYAHEKGIVHRDLKPANIKITPEGRVKVLDFGLAKAMTDDAPAGDPASSPTLTMRGTLAGMIMGTAAYMSPEQARGHAVDKRADIWAFGVVVYEMLTGRQLFGGPTVSDTLAAVLKEQPDLELVPPQMRRLVRLCLAKDPRQRMRDIGDARFLMDDAPPPAVAPGNSVRRVLPWALVAVSLIVAALSFGLRRAPAPAGQPLLSLSVDLGPDARAGRDTTAAISPDGTRIAFPAQTPAGKQALAIRLLSDSKYSLLSGTEGAANPFFSPDGQWVGFFADGKLKKISVHGGAAIALCTASSGRGGSWGEDGYIIASLSTMTGLVRVPEAFGEPQTLTKPAESNELSHRWPQLLPGGQAVLFTAHTQPANFDDANVDVLVLKTGQRKTVQRGGFFGRYLPTGHLVYMRGSTLFAIAFDPERLETKGAPVPLVEGIAATLDFGGGQFDISRNGTLVFLSGKAAASTSRPILWMDQAGKTEPLLSPPGRYIVARISPDGKRLAVCTSSPNFDLWVYDVQRATSTQLTFGEKVQPKVPIWAPDSQHLVYEGHAGTGEAIYWIRADGAGTPQLLLEDKYLLFPSSFSPDGKRLAYFTTSDGAGSPDLWTLPLDMGDPDHPKPGKPEVFLATAAIERVPVFSPDGRWVAYAVNESGTTEVFVRPFAAGAAPATGRWKISNSGGNYPVWSRAGRQLLYQTPEFRIMVIDYTVANGAFEPGRPRPWTDHPEVELLTGGGPAFDLSPDGKRLIVLPRAERPEELKGNLHVTMLVHWFDEVRRRTQGVPPVGK